MTSQSESINDRHLAVGYKGEGGPTSKIKCMFVSDESGIDMITQGRRTHSGMNLISYLTVECHHGVRQGIASMNASSFKGMISSGHVCQHLWLVDVKGPIMSQK